MIRATYEIRKIENDLGRGQITKDTHERRKKVGIIREVAKIVEDAGMLDQSTRDWLVSKASKYAYN